MSVLLNHRSRKKRYVHNTKTIEVYYLFPIKSFYPWEIHQRISSPVFQGSNEQIVGEFLFQTWLCFFFFQNIYGLDRSHFSVNQQVFDVTTYGLNNLAKIADSLVMYLLKILRKLWISEVVCFVLFCFLSNKEILQHSGHGKYTPNLSFSCWYEFIKMF